MPGPVSDSRDPVWGTGENRQQTDDALKGLYKTVSGVLENSDPIYVPKLVNMAEELNRPIPATLSEWEWRIIRFALEWARDSV